MKIAIYEPIHLDWLFPYCTLFSHRKDDVSFFTSVLFEKDLQTVLGHHYKQFHFSYFDATESRSVFRRKLHSFFETAEYDIIILNSIDFRHLFLYEALYKKPSAVAINIHDANNFFKTRYPFHLKTSLRSAGKQLLAKLARGYLVNAKVMQQYILANKLTAKPVFWIPPVVTKAVPPSLGNRPFIITVPGSIDEKRRNYTLVLEAFRKLAAELGQDVKLVLAGKPVGEYGNRILNKAEELQRNGGLIAFYSDEIPEVEFQQIIAQTTLLWSPLCINTSIHDQIEEVYGLTKVSGNIYDAIRHGKPLLVPSQLHLPEEIRSGCIAYSSLIDAQQKLSGFIKHPESFNDIAINAYQNAQQFSLARGLSLLDEMLKGLLR